jgi:hypothetical protein
LKDNFLWPIGVNLVLPVIRARIAVEASPKSILQGQTRKDHHLPILELEALPLISLLSSNKWGYQPQKCIETRATSLAALKKEQVTINKKMC